MGFVFGDHLLDVDRRELRRGADLIAIEPQVFDLLVYLVQNRDRVVSKDNLVEAVWRGRIVSESTLTSRVNAARPHALRSAQKEVANRRCRALYKRVSLIENERTKLPATALNTAATTCFTVGIATPLAGFVPQGATGGYVPNPNAPARLGSDLRLGDPLDTRTVPSARPGQLMLPGPVYASNNDSLLTASPFFR